MSIEWDITENQRADKQLENMYRRLFLLKSHGLVNKKG